MATVNFVNRNKKVEVLIEGSDKSFVIDFGDKRVIAGIMKFLNVYKDAGEKLVKAAEKAEEDDEIGYLGFIDECVEIQTELKAEWCKAVRTNDMLDAIFGEDCLPEVEDYIVLIEELTPYVKNSVAAEQAKIDAISKKYGGHNIK